MRDAKLLIRADADSQTGYGHVMRCLALAQHWSEWTGGSVRFACHEPSRIISTRIQDEGFPVIPIDYRSGSRADALQVNDYASSSTDGTIVIDGYQFDSEYQLMVTRANPQTLVIDDYGHLNEYHAHFLLNQNTGIDRALYHDRTDEETELLIGPDFALLRKEFLEMGPPPAVEPGGRENVLIALGGSDSDGTTQKVIDAIQLMTDEDIAVTLLSAIPELLIDDARIDLVPFANNVSGLYRRADVAICAGGSTNWELSYFGIPRLVIVMADNQSGIARSLDDLECCQSLGWHLELTPEKIACCLSQMLRGERELMRSRNRKLVDGKGASRVVRHLVQRMETMPGRQKTCREGEASSEM